MSSPQRPVCLVSEFKWKTAHMKLVQHHTQEEKRRVFSLKNYLDYCELSRVHKVQLGSRVLFWFYFWLSVPSYPVTFLMVSV